MPKKEYLFYGPNGSPRAVIIRDGNSFTQTIPLDEGNKHFRKWKAENDAKPPGQRLDWVTQIAPAVAKGLMIAAGLGWGWD